MPEAASAAVAPVDAAGPAAQATQPEKSTAAEPVKPPARKGSPRKGGIAARTEVTPAKAFPQQDTGGRELEARDRSAGPGDTAGDTLSARATERPARKPAAPDRTADRGGRGAGNGATAATSDAPADAVNRPAATGATAGRHEATSPPETPTAASTGTVPLSEPIAPVPARPAPSTPAASETTSRAEPETTGPAESAGSQSAGSAEPVRMPAVRAMSTGTGGSAPTGSGSGAPGTSDSAPAAGREAEAAVPEAAGAPGQSPAVLSAVQSAAAQVRRTAKDTWSRVAADPARTPELLALTAVQVIGPRAAGWARDVRESYPTAGPDGIARLAVRQFTRRGGVSSALAAVSGAYAPVALAGTAAYHHAELVLHVAAAYSLDPGDPARAADLLVLTRVHPGLEEAEAAIAAAVAAGRSETGAATTRRLGRTLAVQAGGWAALRAVSRRFPGSALLVAAITSRAATETLGVRATTYYRSVSR
jgi:hypothetical protein